MTDAQKPIDRFGDRMSRIMDSLNPILSLKDRKYVDEKIRHHLYPLFGPQQKEETRLLEIIENYRVEVDELRYMIRERAKTQQATIAERDKEIRELERFAIEYGRHKDGCMRVYHGAGDCDCGHDPKLAAALSEQPGRNKLIDKRRPVTVRISNRRKGFPSKVPDDEIEIIKSMVDAENAEQPEGTEG